jgi:hypothetical protein
VQLRTARLCLDCEEIHDAQQCPVCASETFAFITRWVPAPERRVQQRPSTSDGGSQQQSNSRQPASPRGGRLLKQGVVGLTAVGLLGWLLRRPQAAEDDGARRTPRPPAE